MDLSSIPDDQLLAAIGGAVNPISNAILGQESGNNPNSPTSIDGAVGRGQIIPSTFAQYAKPGENINNDADNLAVHNRIIEDLNNKTGGDPARIAVGYFSGPGNIAPLDSPTPWKKDHVDGNGKSVSSYVSDILGRMPTQNIDSGNQSAETTADNPDVTKLSDEELLKAIGQDNNKISSGEDIAKSVAYRGVPEGLAAATLGGYSLNVIRGVSDLERWAAGKAYKAIVGDDLQHYTENPVPTSSDVLQAASKGLLGKDLYEPKTKLGQYANSITQFATGGKATGIPLTSSIPAAVVSEAAGQAAAGSEYEPAARILGAALGGRSALSARSPETLTADETKAASQAAYKAAEAQGGILAPSFTNSALDILEKAKANPIAGKVLTSESNALNDALGEYAPLKDTPLTLKDYEDLDKSLGAKATAAMDGFKPTNNSRILSQAQDAIREKINSLSDSDVTGGKQGFDVLTKQAIPLYAKQARLNDVEQIVNKAMSTDSPVTSLKKGFSNLVNNKSRFAQFNPDEQSVIRNAAKTGVVSGALKIVGSPLIPAILGIGEDVATGGFTGGVTGYAVGKGLQISANASRKQLQVSKANKVLNTVSNRAATPQPSPLLKLLQSNIQTKPRIRVKAGSNP